MYMKWFEINHNNKIHNVVDILTQQWPLSKYTHTNTKIFKPIHIQSIVCKVFRVNTHTPSVSRKTGLTDGHEGVCVKYDTNIRSVRITISLTSFQLGRQFIFIGIKNKNLYTYVLCVMLFHIKKNFSSLFLALFLLYTWFLKLESKLRQKKNEKIEFSKRITFYTVSFLFQTCILFSIQHSKKRTHRWFQRKKWLLRCTRIE